MYIGRDFDVTDVGEREPFTLDFVKDIDDDEIVESVVVTLAAFIGTDASVATRLFGSALISDRTFVTQKLSGLLPGVTYRIQMMVTTNHGNIVSLWSHVACRTPN